MMDDKQKKLLIKTLKKHYPNSYKTLLQKYPLTGPTGLRRALGEKDIQYFCKAYLPDQFERDFGDYAIEIMNTLRTRIESKAQENQAVVAPREHGKSTISSFAIPTWSAVYEKKKFVLFISANSDTAENFLKKIQKALESPDIVEDFGDLKGSTWNNEEIYLNTGVWVCCTGWKSGLRGMNKDTRPDLIILDDLEDKQTMESPSLREKLERAFREEIGRLGYYKTDYFYIGTLLAEDALLAQVIKDPSWKVLFYKCVTSFPEREDLWDKWRLIYRDINNDNRFDDAYKFYLENQEEMLRGASVLWPGRFPDEEMKYKGAYYNVMLNREKWGEDAFWKEDQNEPRSAKNEVFTLAYWEKWPDKNIPLVLAVDPSEGKGDSTAFAIGGCWRTGYLVQDGYLMKYGPEKTVEFILRLIRQYPQIYEVVVEENLFRELLKKYLRDEMIKNKLLRQIKTVRNTKNKHARIMQIEPLVNGAQILFNRANETFNDEIERYKHGAPHDDAPDVVEILISRLRKNRGTPRNKPKGW